MRRQGARCSGRGGSVAAIALAGGKDRVLSKWDEAALAEAASSFRGQAMRAARGAPAIMGLTHRPTPQQALPDMQGAMHHPKTRPSSRASGVMPAGALEAGGNRNSSASIARSISWASSLRQRWREAGSVTGSFVTAPSDCHAPAALKAFILSAVAEGDVVLAAVWPPERVVP